MSEIKILKAKLIKGGESLKTVEKRSEHGVRFKAPFDYDNAVHPDMIKVFQAFRPHLAALSGIIPMNQITDKDKLEMFIPIGFTMTKDDAAVVLTGRYENPYGGFTFNTKPIPLTDEGEQPYQLIGDFIKCVDKAKEEVLLYIGGKVAQPELDFNTDEPITGALIAEPVGQTTIGNKLPKADKDAQQRVSEWSPKDYQEEVDKTSKNKAANVGKNGRKKVAQTSATPSGETED